MPPAARRGLALSCTRTAPATSLPRRPRVLVQGESLPLFLVFFLAPLFLSRRRLVAVGRQSPRASAPLAQPGPVKRPDPSGWSPAVLPAWASREAGSLRPTPGLAPVWAGLWAGRLRHCPGLKPAWADLWAGPNSKSSFI